MNILNSIKTCATKSFRFSGRAMRSEYWWYLFSYIVTYVVSFFLIFGLRPDEETELSIIVDYAFLFAMLVLAFPLLSAGSRRLHDVGRSGWWLLLTPLLSALVFSVLILIGTRFEGPLYVLGALVMILSPILSFFLVLFWLVKPGVSAPNKYGKMEK